jgi:general L-amino acid transport system substrate-binding protein
MPVAPSMRALPRIRALTLIALLACGGPSALPAHAAAGAVRAGAVVARVQARGAVRCGSVERPGIAQSDGTGQWRGLAVDICRAVAAAVLGSAQRFEYHSYETGTDYERVRSHADDLYFLTGREIVEGKLIGALLPGPTVFIASDGAMVPATSPVQHLADLAGKGVCFMIADPAEQALGAYFAKANLPWFRHPYSEHGEMEDAYAVQRCAAVAAERTELARIRLLPGQTQLRSRILPEPLNAFPLIAATSTADGRWSAIVAWTIHTLVDAERPESDWMAGGARALPIPAADLGLATDWQSRVLQATGHYGQIYARNLGDGSPYLLERGFNSNQLEGGLQLSPFVE